MKKTCVLAFNSLADLAHFLKSIQPESYTINTVRLTIAARLTPFECAVAQDNYRANEVKCISV